MHTVVGTGELGDAPDGDADLTSLNHPTHMSVSPRGTFIIAAWHNSKLLEFDPASGMLKAICGNGMRSFGGDGGPAAMALLDLPTATAFDKDGNMYITDQANQRIRMVDNTKEAIINTVVGTGMPGFSGDGMPALAAQIKLPGGQSAPPAGRIAIDGEGNLIIADSANHRIRKVDLEGIITTIAGTGDPTFGGDGGDATKASLSRPNDVDHDKAGNLYIADTDNACIRKVDTAGKISTFAGKCGQPGFDGDGGDATAALLDRPYGITFDASENLYIADTHNHLIRVVYK
jgi:sugar lactone lactonase YvrE